MQSCGRPRAPASLAPGPAGDRAALLYAASSAMYSTELATRAYAMLQEPGGDALPYQVERRLHALLVDRVTPLLLRTLQLWKGGARRARPARCPRSPCRALRSRAGAVGRAAWLASVGAAPAHCLVSGCAACGRGRCRRAWLSLGRCAHQHAAPGAPALRRAPTGCPKGDTCMRWRSARAARGPARRPPARRAAGGQRVPDHLACQCSAALGGMLEIPALGKRMPARERLRCMRRMYEVLQWAAEGLGDLVRARARRSAPTRPSSRRQHAEWTQSSASLLAASFRAAPPSHARTGQRSRRCVPCAACHVAVCALPHLCAWTHWLQPGWYQRDAPVTPKVTCSPVVVVAWQSTACVGPCRQLHASGLESLC